MARPSQITIAAICISLTLAAQTKQQNLNSTTPVFVHQYLDGLPCDLVQRGQLLRYAGYASIALDGIRGEVYSPELAQSDYVEYVPSAQGNKAAKAASKSGFAVKRLAIATSLEVPRVVATTPGTQCPGLEEAAISAAKQRADRRRLIQSKLYRPGVDDVVAPTPEAPSQPKPEPQESASRENAAQPQAKHRVKHGTVVLTVAIGIDGEVEDTKVTHALDPYLDEKAREAVKSWRFRPARKKGLPVPALVTVEVNFRPN